MCRVSNSLQSLRDFPPLTILRAQTKQADLAHTSENGHPGMLKFLGSLVLAVLVAMPLPATAAQVASGAHVALAALGEFPAGRTSVELPARFVDGDIIVRLSIAGSALDFVLDSGSSNIVIDADVASELHLNGAPDVDDGATRVAIPEMNVGALRLRDVRATTMNLQYRAKDRTPIAGLLGYDFLAKCVVHVDYEHRRAYAIAPDAFHAGDLGATALPIALDDGVPMVRAKVGNSEGDRFIVDSGADDVYLFDAFARSHASAVTDRRGAVRQFSDLPYLDSDGDPARFPLVAVDITDFTLGDIDFRHVLAYRITPGPADAGFDADGLIGYRFLRYYDVYFDYPAARLYLVNNDLAPR